MPIKTLFLLNLLTCNDVYVCGVSKIIRIADRNGLLLKISEALAINFCSRIKEHHRHKRGRGIFMSKLVSIRQKQSTKGRRGRRPSIKPTSASSDPERFQVLGRLQNSLVEMDAVGLRPRRGDCHTQFGYSACADGEYSTILLI